MPKNCSILIPPLELWPLRPRRILAAKWREIQKLIGTQERLGLPPETGVGVVDLAVLVLGKHTHPRLLSTMDIEVHTTIFPLLLGAVVVQNGEFVLVKRHVEIVVEVAALRRVPVEAIPTHSRLVRSKLVGSGARNDSHICVAALEVVEIGQVVDKERATAASFLPAWFEHEMVDDQLGFALEEISKMDVHLLSGFWVDEIEGVVFCHCCHGKFAMLGGECVLGSNEFFFFHQ